jgi:hypothetical protein
MIVDVHVPAPASSKPAPLSVASSTSS